MWGSRIDLFEGNQAPAFGFWWSDTNENVATFVRPGEDLDYTDTTAFKKECQSIRSWKQTHCSLFCKSAKGQRQVGMSELAH